MGDYIFLPERPEKIIKKGLFKKIDIVVEDYKPEGFYYNRDYSRFYITKNDQFYVIDSDNNTISTRAEVIIGYTDGKYNHFYYQNNEEANKVFQELKQITNLFEI